MDGVSWGDELACGEEQRRILEAGSEESREGCLMNVDDCGQEVLSSSVQFVPGLVYGCEMVHSRHWQLVLAALHLDLVQVTVPE